MLGKKGLMAAIIVGMVLYVMLPNASASDIEKDDVEEWVGYSSCTNGAPFAYAYSNRLTVDEGTWVGSEMFIEETRIDHDGYENTQGFEDVVGDTWGAGMRWQVRIDEQIDDEGWGAHLFYGSQEVTIWSKYKEWNLYNYEKVSDYCTITVIPNPGGSDWDIATDYREGAKIAIKIDTVTYNTTAPPLEESKTVEGIIIYSYEGTNSNSILYNTTSQQTSYVSITLFAN